MMTSKRIAGLSLVAMVGFMLLLWQTARHADTGPAAGGPLVFYCAAGVRAAVEPVAQAYEKEYGVSIQLQFGGSGTLLSNIQVSNIGDLYLAADQGYLDRIRPNITFRASGCVAIVEAIAEGIVDAGFGWTAFKHLDKDRLDVVELPPEQQIWRGTGVGLLSFSKNPVAAEQFMDFLVSPESRKYYLECGWVLPT